MIERVVRVANTFAEATAFDRDDIAALSLEERISGVERLRRPGSVKIDLNRDWSEFLCALIA